MYIVARRARSCALFLFCMELERLSRNLCRLNILNNEQVTAWKERFMFFAQNLVRIQNELYFYRNIDRELSDFVICCRGYLLVY